MALNVVKQIFAASLDKAGFVRKSDSWYSETADAILVANLQKSNFGDQYYINLAVWLKTLGEMRYPKENRCHIRIRASALEGERQRYWEREVLDLEYRNIGDEERSTLIRSFLEEIALPFLLAAGSLENLRKLWRGGRLKAAAVIKDAARVLEDQGL